MKECDDAWADLSAYVATAFTPALRRSLAATLGLSEAEVDTAVQSSLDAIAGAGVDAQNYMIMAAAGFLPKGEAQVYAEIGHWDAAAMITQAAQQRNTQWAAEETLFARIVRPMMTFFEAFLFAVSPLMVFAVGLGIIGIRMIGKYLLFGLWIQLWQPILAVVNLYILMTVRESWTCCATPAWATWSCRRCMPCGSSTSSCPIISGSAACWPPAPRRSRSC